MFMYKLIIMRKKIQRNNWSPEVIFDHKYIITIKTKKIHFYSCENRDVCINSKI